MYQNMPGLRKVGVVPDVFARFLQVWAPALPQPMLGGLENIVSSLQNSMFVYEQHSTVQDVVKGEAC